MLGHVDDMRMWAGPKETAQWIFTLGGLNFMWWPMCALLWDLSISSVSQRGTGCLLCEQLIEEKPISFVSERERMTKNIPLLSWMVGGKERRRGVGKSSRSWGQEKEEIFKNFLKRDTRYKLRVVLFLL